MAVRRLNKTQSESLFRNLATLKAMVLSSQGFLDHYAQLMRMKPATLRKRAALYKRLLKALATLETIDIKNGYIGEKKPLNTQPKGATVGSKAAVSYCRSQSKRA